MERSPAFSLPSLEVICSIFTRVAVPKLSSEVKLSLTFSFLSFFSQSKIIVSFFWSIVLGISYTYIGKRGIKKSGGKKKIKEIE